MPELAQRPADEVRAQAGLHAHEIGGSFSNSRSSASRLIFRRRNDRSLRIEADDVEHVLPDVDPDRCDCRRLMALVLKVAPPQLGA